MALGFLAANAMPASDAFLEVISSFQLEFCLLILAILLAKTIQGGWLKAAQHTRRTSCSGRGGPSFPAVDQPEHREMVSTVEDLVAKDRTKDAWALANRVWQKPKMWLMGHVNVYSTILRGFAKAKQHEEVCALYGEMLERNVPINTITYNIVLNSMVRTGQFGLIPGVLEAMKNSGKRGAPNYVTFSTIIDGYCRSGDVDAGLRVLAQMTEEGITPDELTFNSLLGGCAQRRRVKEALWLLDLMEEKGVPPSNYTMSITVKVIGRANLTKAFAMVEKMSSNYNLKPNIHVYTCLMQACFQRCRVNRALHLYNQVAEEKRAPIDAKTYTVLARGCLSNGAYNEAAMVVRTAYHLPCEGGWLHVQEGHPQGITADCLREVLSKLAREVPEVAHALENDLEG